MLMVRLCILYLYLWSNYVYFIYAYGPTMYNLSVRIAHLGILYLYLWSNYVYFIYAYGPTMYNLSVRIAQL